MPTQPLFCSTQQGSPKALRSEKFKVFANKLNAFVESYTKAISRLLVTDLLGLVITFLRKTNQLHLQIHSIVWLQILLCFGMLFHSNCRRRWRNLKSSTRSFMIPEKAQYYINQLQMLKHPEASPSPSPSHNYSPTVSESGMYA